MHTLVILALKGMLVIGVGQTGESFSYQEACFARGRALVAHAGKVRKPATQVTYRCDWNHERRKV